jgi:hypothetical protein
MNEKDLLKGQSKKKLLFLRTSKMPRQSCRSPIFTRRPQQQIQKIINTNVDITPSSLQPMALLSLDTNGSILPINDEVNNNRRQIIIPPLSTTVTNNNKRSFESSTSEQILIKRRYQKPIPCKYIFFN